MSSLFNFQMTVQTIKDNFKITLIVTLLFMGMAAMYAGMYPTFKESLLELTEGFSDSFGWLSGVEDMASYVGFLNVEMYQIFWLLILAILIGFIAASTISKEVEGKTIDLLLSNPVSRKQIIFEKYIAMIPMILIINFATFIAVYATTIAIDEEINLGYLFMTHVVSIPYFLAVLGIGFVISVIVDEKMKASIVMVAIIVGMYIFESISLMASDYEALGLLSITHYFNPYDILKFGEIDVVGVVVLIVVTVECLLFSMLYFDWKDINVS